MTIEWNAACAMRLGDVLAPSREQASGRGALAAQVPCTGSLVLSFPRWAPGPCPGSPSRVLPGDRIERFKAGPVSGAQIFLLGVFRVPRGASLRTRIHDLKTKYYALWE